MVRPLYLALLVLPAVLSAHATNKSPLKSVDHVDLRRYAGRWHEIARLPNRFESKCDRNVTADYVLDSNSVRVSNACVKADGTQTISRGRAKIVDTTTNAKLKITFFWPFYGNYWIIGLDPEYRWAVVGEPSRKYLWILSRTPKLSPADSTAADKVIEQSGYDRSSLVTTKQDESPEPPR